MIHPVMVDHRDIEELHAEACCHGESSYTDPVTGYRVFTSVGLQKRGRCCGSGCRHCPYGRMNCAPEQACRDTTPLEYIRGRDVGDKQTPIDGAVVFFSGGKDSFLAMYYAQQKYGHVILLSTYDPQLQMNGIQQVPIHRIREFASVHRLDLVTIPVSMDTMPYPDMVEKGIQLIRASVPEVHIRQLVFGDIHLEHIRQWRVDEFSKRLGYECWFPLWKRPYDTLLTDLGRACSEYHVSFVFSAIYDEKLLEIQSKRGKKRDSDDVGLMPTFQDSIGILEESGVDIFGEHGEFHTMVIVSRK